MIYAFAISFADTPICAMLALCSGIGFIFILFGLVHEIVKTRQKE